MNSKTKKEREDQMQAVIKMCQDEIIEAMRIDRIKWFREIYDEVVKELKKPTDKT